MEAAKLEVKKLSFLLVPEWSHPSGAWSEVVAAFFRAFTPEDEVSLVLPYDPDEDLEALSATMGRIAAQAGRELEEVPDTVLHPEESSAVAWRALALQTQAVLVASDAATGWLQDLPVAALVAPGEAALRSYQVLAQPSPGQREALALMAQLPGSALPTLESFLTLLLTPAP